MGSHEEKRERCGFGPRGLKALLCYSHTVSPWPLPSILYRISGLHTFFFLYLSCSFRVLLDSQVSDLISGVCEGPSLWSVNCRILKEVLNQICWWWPWPAKETNWWSSFLSSTWQLYTQEVFLSALYLFWSPQYFCISYSKQDETK